MGSLRVKFLLIVFVLFTAAVFGGCGEAESSDQGAMEKAEDFTLATSSGGGITLSEEISKGGAVIVFFTTWCPYCAEEVPKVNDYYLRNKERISVFAVDVKETSDKVNAFIGDKGVKYPVAMDSDGAVARKYKVSGIPTVIAVDKDGNILYRGHDISQMENKVKF